VSLPHLVPDVAGDSICKILEIFIVHFLGKCDQASHLTLHFGDFFMAATATLTVGAIICTFACAGIELHGLWSSGIGSFMILERVGNGLTAINNPLTCLGFAEQAGLG